MKQRFFLALLGILSTAILAGSAITHVSRPGLGVGDLNNDGKLDVVRINADFTTSILLNDGNNTFTEAYRYPVSSISSPAILADLNHDGNLDVAIGNQLFLGNGTGALQAPRTLVGDEVLAIADVNKDGNPDLLLAKSTLDTAGTITVQVFAELGDGTGNFSAPLASVPYGARGASAILLADVNGDGNPDVIADSCYFDCKTVVMLGDGTGNFGIPQAVGAGPLYSVADINNDGKLDIYSEGIFFAGKGDGSFTELTAGASCAWSDVYPATSSQVCTLADFNGDGKLDLLVSCASGRCVELGDGLGNFGADVAFPGTNPVGGGPVGDAIVDFNGDGRPDLILLNSDGSITFAANPGTWPPVSIKLGSTIALASSANPANSGQTLTITATVAAAPGTAGGGTPTGTLTFSGVGALALTTTLDEQGKASVSTSTLPLGTTTISAQYSGDTTYFASNAQFSQQVLSPFAGATTTLVASASSAQVGQLVTFSAAVTPAAGTGTPTGTVSFADGANLLGTAPLNGNAVGVLSTKLLASGSHSIIASYSGDANFTAGTSMPVQVSITVGDLPCNGHCYVWCHESHRAFVSDRESLSGIPTTTEVSWRSMYGIDLVQTATSQRSQYDQSALVPDNIGFRDVILADNSPAYIPHIGRSMSMNIRTSFR